MDPHFNEYLAAAAGMMDFYGKPLTDSSVEAEPRSPIKAEHSGGS